MIMVCKETDDAFELVYLDVTLFFSLVEKA